MSLSIIVAIAKNGVIGLKNRLPWHLPEDLKHFKEITLGHPILMGDRTFESLGKPLPGRENVVLTLDKNYSAKGVVIIHSLDEAVKRYATKEAFVIGGATIYKLALPLADKLYLTLIDKDFEGDAFFPETDLKKDFQMIEESPRFISEKEKIPYRFVTAIRRS